MTAKEQIIKEAWIAEIGEEKYNDVKSMIDEDGWIVQWKIEYINRELIKSFESYYQRNGHDFCRPKSLQGIESNNGWNRIDEVGLPSDNGQYWVRTSNSLTLLHTVIKPLEAWEQVEWKIQYSHWQKCIIPNPPIY